MTAIYIALLLLQVGIAIFFVRRGRKLKAARMAAEAAAAAAIVPDTYEGMRSQALGVTPANLKLGIPDSETFVYGVIMDWNMGDTLVTLATYITGAASMYLSSGGGMHGGGKNPTVGESASELVNLAQSYIARAIPTTLQDLPSQGCVRFYLLTNHHVYAAQEQIVHFDDATSPWLPMFEKANEVIVEMRAVLN